MNALGLLIQGPLHSVGRTGKTVTVGAPRVTEGDIVSFDCRPNIDALLSKFGHLFTEVVVSTWDDGVFPDFAPRGARVIRTKDTTTALPRKPGVANETVAINNMLRQFYGSWVGMQAFSRVDFVVKIRTDTFLDLDKITAEVQPGDDRIRVPYVIRGMNHLPDFYFCSTHARLLDFFAILGGDADCFSTSPHLNSVLKYCRHRYFEQIGVAERFYRPLDIDHQGAEVSRVFAYAFNNLFLPLSRDVFESMVWRGDGWSDSYRKRLATYTFGYPDLYQPRPSRMASLEAAFLYERASPLANALQRASLKVIMKYADVFDRCYGGGRANHGH